MSTANTSSQEIAHGSIRSYAVGFILSIILTLAAYMATTRNLAAGWALISVLAGLALVQLVVRLLFFLHLGSETKPRWNLVVLGFMLTVLLILVFGSLWIMYNLNYNHIHTTSPEQTDTYIIHDEGIQN